MIPALLIAAACWLAVPPSAARRARSLWASERPASRRLTPDVGAGALTPLAGLLLLGWPWGVLIGLAAAPLVRGAVRRMDDAQDRRRDDQMRRQLPVALDLIAAALSGGRTPASAIALTADAVDAPIGAELAAVADRLAVSGDVRTALVDLPEALAVVGRSLLRADESGAPVAVVVAAAADDVRRDSRAERREVARRIGVRTAAPLGLCFLPAFLLVGIVPTVIALAGSVVG